MPLTANYMGNETGWIAGEISEDEACHGRPMLGALAIASTGIPGKGFFDLARKLGRLHKESREAEVRFWKEETAALYETWRQEFKT
ncbi:hypothetical protein ACFLT5_01695 [Chloroflexota bacterium]